MNEINGYKLTVIESPFAGRGWWPFSLFRRWLNIRYARACLKDSLKRGEAPFASHLLYTQRGVLNDLDVQQRAWGISAGFAWGLKAQTVAVYTDRGISSGMKYGIQRAEDAMQVIEFRSLKRP